MLEQLIKLWATLNSQQRRNVILLAVVTGAALAGLVVWSGRANYAALYGDLSTEDSVAIVDYLRSNNINYRLAAGGNLIQVDRSRLYDLRLQLAQEGLPRGGGGVGFEIFDRTGLPGTEFSNNVNYQRALQGELARTIASLQTVRSARVHLVLPQYDLYSGQQPASASVTLDTRAGQLSRAQIQGIAYLVSSAVKQLQPSQVTIVNGRGDILSSPESHRGSGGVTLQQLQATCDYEQNLRAELQRMLDNTVGPNKSIIQVQIALNFDAESIHSEIIEPLEGKNSVLQERLTQEEYSGSTSQPGGPAGMSPAATAGPGGSPTSGGTYSSSQEARQYQHSRIQKDLQKAPGQIKRLTVAAIIDETVEGISLRQIERLLGAAAGIDSTRGDQVIVQQMPLQAASIADEEAAAAEKAVAAVRSEQLMQTALRYGIMLILGVVVAGGLLMSSKQLRAFSEQQAQLAPTAPPPGERPAEQSAPVSQPAVSAPDSQTAPPVEDYIQQLQDQNPEVTAQQIAKMMEGSQ